MRPSQRARSSIFRSSPLLRSTPEPPLSRSFSRYRLVTMMLDTDPIPPPPKRLVRATPEPHTPYSDALTAKETETWGGWFKRHGKSKGTVAMEKGISWSDKLGHKMNAWAEAAGSERFYPVTGDFHQELDKCTRILRAFTVDGVEGSVTVESKTASGAARKQQKKVVRKIPAKIIREAKGIAIFTSMRSGIAPLGGAGGAGMIIARLEDDSWSAPSSMSPNNLSLGLMLGVDVYDCVLILRTDEALAAFMGHTVTLGAELGVAAGPYGAGAVVETGMSRTPVLSYIRSRGVYAGFEAVAQAYITRTEENENAYFWPGITPREILTGKVRAPREAEELHQALEDAETGRAQRQNGDEFEFEQPFSESENLDLNEGEVLRLPPTPAQIEEEEEEERRLEAIRDRNEKRYLR